MKRHHLEDQLAIARQALEDVVNPIAMMERFIAEGARLSGGTAVELAKDPYYLRDIAAMAIREIEKIDSDEG